MPGPRRARHSAAKRSSGGDAVDVRVPGLGDRHSVVRGGAGGGQVGGQMPGPRVRKTPSWPGSWANSSLFPLCSHMNARANTHLLGQPNIFLAQMGSALSWSYCGEGAGSLLHLAPPPPGPTGSLALVIWCISYLVTCILLFVLIKSQSTLEMRTASISPTSADGDGRMGETRTSTAVTCVCAPRACRVRRRNYTVYVIINNGCTKFR